jgi:hypothetical protein
MVTPPPPILFLASPLRIGYKTTTSEKRRGGGDCVIELQTGLTLSAYLCQLFLNLSSSGCFDCLYAFTCTCSSCTCVWVCMWRFLIPCFVACEWGGGGRGEGSLHWIIKCKHRSQWRQWWAPYWILKKVTIILLLVTRPKKINNHSAFRYWALKDSYDYFNLRYWALKKGIVISPIVAFLQKM